MIIINKSKIEWCDYTFNPVTGCLHDCPYCYARRIANRFAGKWTIDKGECIPNGKGYKLTEQLLREINGNSVKVAYPFGFTPTFHHYRLDEPKRKTKPSKIFVSSMGDLFGDWVPAEWIDEVFSACKRADYHTYMFLTKNPKRYSQIYKSKLDYRCYMWFGTTITNDDDIQERGFDLFCSTGEDRDKHAKRFLSIEPLLEEISQASLQNLKHVDWIIIGAQTGPGAVPPKPEWVKSIIVQARAAGVPVFLKNNLNWPEKIEEFPEGMKK